MTSMRLEDISRKRQVSSKYTPNSYRIFCEEIGNNSVPDDAKYSNQAPPIYTNPLIVPAQAIEDRNNPQGGRSAHFLRENYHTLNEPVSKISTKKISKAEESRWWEWNAAGEDRDPNWKNKKRSSSAARAETNPNDKNFIDPSSFQTTYQKEHGYLKNFQVKPNELQNEYNGAVQRHSMNPNTVVATGIVPVTDITSYSKQGEQQRVFLDKMSFEHGYDARKNDNYPPRGKRQGGFVMEQIEPKPPVGLKARPNFNRGASVWDVMHPEYKNGEDKDNDLNGKLNGSRGSLSAQKPPSGHVNRESRRNNERRDPIGYYSDDKFGGSMGADLPNLAPGPSFNQNIKANTREAAYNPSWQQPGGPVGEPQYMSANQLLEDAMRYQRPILAAEEY